MSQWRQQFLSPLIRVSYEEYILISSVFFFFNPLLVAILKSQEIFVFLRPILEH